MSLVRPALEPVEYEPLPPFALWPDADPQRVTKPAPALPPSHFDRQPVARVVEKYPVHEQVYDALPGTVLDLANRLGRSKGSIQRAILRLREEGRLGPLASGGRGRKACYMRGA